jgi:hypothetical protein
MQRLTFVFIFLLATTVCSYAQSNNELVDDFQESDWITVLDAKQEIENREKELIPELIMMLDENREVKLKNTGDLIYPGAEKFYGHGKIIDYDIDNLAIRAGWLLEDITFENFGFSGIHIQAEKLVPFVKYTYPQYYSENEKAVDEMSEAELRKLIREKSITSAQQWWTDNSDSWTRLKGLENAMKSEDERRRAKVLSYLRNGTTKCSGLDNNFYKSDLHAMITKLSKSNIKRVSEQAKLILDDTSQEWLKIKQ